MKSHVRFDAGKGRHDSRKRRMVDDTHRIMWKQLLTASAAMQIALAGGPSQLPGSPIVYADEYVVIRGAPVVGDIDGDGYLEIVATGWVSIPDFGPAGWIGVYRHHGTPYHGWPKIAPVQSVVKWGQSPISENT